MRERGIILQPWEVRAFLDNRKQRLTRLVKPQPTDYTPGPNRHEAKHERAYLDAYCNARKTPENPRGMSDRWCWWSPDDRQGPDWIRCPFGSPGDRLWGRETWAPRTLGAWPKFDRQAAPIHRADGDRPEWKNIWRSPVTMPRWASRILLEVESVRVQRVQDITETEAMQEGVDRTNGHPIRGALHGAGPCFREGVAQALEDVSPGAWDRNDWVFAATVKRLEVDRG